MDRYVLILVLLLASSAAARDLVQVEITSAPVAASEAAAAPDAPSEPLQASLATVSPAVPQPIRGVCYFDAAIHSLVFHRGSTLPATAPAGAAFCIFNLRRPALDTCGASNVVVDADKQCKCADGFDLDPFSGACVATTSVGISTLVDVPEEVVDPMASMATMAPDGTLLNAIAEHATVDGPADHADVASLDDAAMPSAVAATSGVSPAATLPTCVDLKSASTCTSWKSSGLCALDRYTTDTLKFYGTELCPRTCGRCGCRDEVLFYKEDADQAAARCRQWKAGGYCATKWVWTDKFDNQARIGSFWCAATCGSCAGPEASWTTGKFANKQLSVAGVGVYVWKTSAAFTSHVLGNLERHAGAHYYASAPYTTRFNSAISYMVMPSLNLPSGSGRIACMAFNARGSDNCGIDFGVENNGTGWFAMGYGGCTGRSRGSPPTTQYPMATKVLIGVLAKVTATQDTVVGSFTFYNSAGAELGRNTLIFTEAKGAFFPYTVPAPLLGTGAVAPKVRWTRFMSLLHSGGHDYALRDKADGSSMVNAQFTDLRLGDWAAKTYIPWDSSLVEHAWHVETANVNTLTISSTTARDKDTFSCKQQVQYI